MLTGCARQNVFYSCYILHVKPLQCCYFAGLLNTYVSIPGQGSILPLESLFLPNWITHMKCEKKCHFFTSICMANCYLNIEIFLLKIDIVMSFVFDVAWNWRHSYMYIYLEYLIKFCDMCLMNSFVVYKCFSFHINKMYIHV